MGLAKHQAVLQHLQELDGVVSPKGTHLPLLEPLQPLFGGDLPKGWVVSLAAQAGSANSSLALALAAATTAQGSWVVALGWPSLGLVAAHNLGVNLNRLVLADVSSSEETLLALDTLVGSVELIMVNNLRLNGREHRHLTSRLRTRGTTLISVNTSWHTTPDITLWASTLSWEGLGNGHGHLRLRRVNIRSRGRRKASQERSVQVWLPGPEGKVESASSPVPVTSLRAI